MCVLLIWSLLSFGQQEDPEDHLSAFEADGISMGGEEAPGDSPEGLTQVGFKWGSTQVPPNMPLGALPSTFASHLYACLAQQDDPAQQHDMQRSVAVAEQGSGSPMGSVTVPSSKIGGMAQQALVPPSSQGAATASRLLPAPSANQGPLKFESPSVVSGTPAGLACGLLSARPVLGHARSSTWC